MGLMGENTVQQSDFEITFHSDHDLSKLQALWDGESRFTLPVHLSLISDVPEGESLPLYDPASETKRLQVLIDHIAHVRSEMILAQCANGSAVQLEEGSLLFLSQDKLVAWLFLLPPVGQGKKLNTFQLYQILTEHNVKVGVNWKLLRELSTSSQRYFRLFPVAWGKAPIAGHDGYVVDRYARSFDGNIEVNELGQADYQTLQLVQEIQEGDVICDICPQTEGIPGLAVTGEAVPAPMGKAAVIPQGRNTHVSEDGKSLVADCTGHVCFSGRSFQVKPVLHLTQEELTASQYIKFLGDVHIHGDLGEGVSICALGNIQVDGVVEDCSIEAGENIVVSSGVQGQNQAVLQAQKSLYAKYLENCRAYAQENIFADCIINSDVYSNGTIQVLTGRGVLIGGTIRAAREIYAAAVGSKAERPTDIVLGGKPCDEAQRDQISEEMDHLTSTIEQLERQAVSPERNTKLGKLKLNQCVAKMKLEKLDKELDEYKATMYEQDKNFMRIFCTVVYPGTNVTIGNDIFHVEQVKENCVIGQMNGRTGYI